MSSQLTSGEAPRVFPPTRWSVVLAATQRPSPESAAALEAICNAYWYPLYVYIRRCGRSVHDAQDLTQEFFRRLLEKRWLDSVDRNKGRLRSFLIVALKKFMFNEWDRLSAQRRGGGRTHAQIDTTFAESRLAADTHSLAPDETYDRQWALTLISLTTNRLRAEFAAAGRPGDYDALKHCLLADRGAIDYAAVAAQLDVNAGTARVAVHRLRQRYRKLIQAEVASTVAGSEEAAEEMRHLFQVLSAG